MHAQIIGGLPTSINKFPYYVTVSVKGIKIGNELKSNTCGGSIVSEWNILTAAHCVNFDDGEVEVFAGTAKPNDRRETRSIHRENIVKHPGFNPFTMEHDLAVLLMAEPLPINKKTIDIVNLPKKGHKLEDGKMLTVCGVGFTGDQFNRFKDHLHCISIPTQNFEKCQMHYAGRNQNFRVTDYMFCAGFYDDAVCISHGDSGG